MKVKGLIIKCKAKDLLKAIKEQDILNLDHTYKGGFTYSNDKLKKEVNYGSR